MDRKLILSFVRSFALSQLISLSFVYTAHTRANTQRANDFWPAFVLCVRAEN